MITTRQTYYESLEGVRSSIIKEMWKSPAHAKTAIETDSKVTPTRYLGYLAHARILEPDFYKTLSETSVANTTKHGFIGKEQARKCDAMYLSILLSEFARTILKSAEREICIQWTEERKRSVQCKALIDLYSSELKLIADLKTTTDASEDKFINSIFEYGYDIQMAHYRAGIESRGTSVESCVIIAVESKEPFNVGIFDLSEQTLADAERTRKYCLDLYSQCVAEDNWPGYGEKITLVERPIYINRMEAHRT